MAFSVRRLALSACQSDVRETGDTVGHQQHSDVDFKPFGLVLVSTCPPSALPESAR